MYDTVSNQTIFRNFCIHHIFKTTGIEFCGLSITMELRKVGTYLTPSFIIDYDNNQQQITDFKFYPLFGSILPTL